MAGFIYLLMTIHVINIDNCLFITYAMISKKTEINYWKRIKRTLFIRADKHKVGITGKSC